MSIATLLRSLLSGSATGAVADVPVESRCYAWVQLANGLMAQEARTRHQWVQRGVRFEHPTCLRCGARNPHVTTEVVEA